MGVKASEGWYDISVPLKQGMSMPRNPASLEMTDGSHYL